MLGDQHGALAPCNVLPPGCLGWLHCAGSHAASAAVLWSAACFRDPPAFGVTRRPCRGLVFEVWCRLAALALAPDCRLIRGSAGRMATWRTWRTPPSWRWCTASTSTRRQTGGTTGAGEPLPAACCMCDVTSGTCCVLQCGFGIAPGQMLFSRTMYHVR
jgi:hypothetical protein